MKANGVRTVLAAACMSVALASFAQSSDVAPNGDMASGATSTTSQTKADRALARAVRRALGKAPGFNVSGVFVRARSGAVTLSGTVRTGGQISQAEQVAHTVQGVTSVSNKLTLFHGGNG